LQQRENNCGIQLFCERSEDVAGGQINAEIPALDEGQGFKAGCFLLFRSVTFNGVSLFGSSPFTVGQIPDIQVSKLDNIDHLLPVHQLDMIVRLVVLGRKSCHKVHDGHIFR